MHSLRLYGPMDVRLDELPAPRPPVGGAVVRVEYCAICGSDLRNIKSGGSHRGMTLPRTLGHEIAGTVEEVGPGVPGLEPGQRVVLAVVIPCGECAYCLAGAPNVCDSRADLSYHYDGGFAQYIELPASHLRAAGVIAVPEEVSLMEVCLAEPFSCALNGMRHSRVSLGDVVVIIGAGPVGLMHCILAKMSGASRVMVSEINPHRLELAAAFTEIDRCIDATREDPVQVVREETAGRGADVVVVAAPSGPAQVQATYMAARRGRVNLFGGLPPDQACNTFDSNLIHQRELFVHGSSSSTLSQIRTIVELMSAGRLPVRQLISARYPLTQYTEAMEVARSGKALKVLLQPWG